MFHFVCWYAYACIVPRSTSGLTAKFPIRFPFDFRFAILSFPLQSEPYTVCVYQAIKLEDSRPTPVVHR